jgi:hypothetical protein
MASWDEVLLETIEDTKMETQNRKIDEGETTQWPKEEVQKDKSDLQNIVKW